MLTAIVGINWGDEGKGRMVDLLSKDFDIVCRYQGGNNAGHTVINERGKFILNLLPSGILREGVVCVMGPGMVVDIRHLAGEMARLREAGIRITPENLKISDRAVITMPYNVAQDCLEEERLADKKFGSTKRGIAPVYADKYLKKAFRMGELLDPERLKKRLPDIVEWKNLTLVGAYGAKPVTVEEMFEYFRTYGEPLKEYICDVGLYLNEAHKAGKNIMLEAQLGALRDNRLRHLSLYLLIQQSGGIRPHRCGRSQPENGQDDRHHEGVFFLRGRGPVHGGVFRRKGGKTAHGGRRIRGSHRAVPAAWDPSMRSLRNTACAARVQTRSRSQSWTSFPAMKSWKSASGTSWTARF